jgi:hypothetical protein
MTSLKSLQSNQTPKSLSLCQPTIPRVFSFPYFFLPFLPLAEPPADAVDVTLDALDGVAELFLLDLTDLTLSSALFCGPC